MKKLLPFYLLFLIVLSSCSKENDAATKSPAAITNATGGIPSVKQPGPPPPTPEEYTAMGYKTAYNIIVSGMVPSAQNTYYQNTLSLAKANGLTDYQIGLMAGAQAGDIKIKGAFFSGVTTIPDIIGYTYQITFVYVERVDLTLHLSDGSSMVYSYYR